MLGLEHIVLFQRQSDEVLASMPRHVKDSAFSYSVDVPKLVETVKALIRNSPSFAGTKASARIETTQLRQGGSPMQVKYHSFTPGLNPRRTKLEVPGWGGERQPRQDGSMEQAWHCLPFCEGADTESNCSTPMKTSYA